MSILSRIGRLTPPAYKLTVNGLPVGTALKDRLVSLSVTLNNGTTSDQLSLTVDDRSTLFGNDMMLPTRGVTLTVSMGYTTWQEKMGSFIVNNVSLNGSSGGRNLTISATPALMMREISETWANMPIAKIVEKIAGKHKLTAAVSPSFRLKTIEVINQLDESDLAFLTRLAARYNAVCKPMASKLLFMKKGQGTSASGLPMLPVIIPAQDVVQWSTQVNERQDYGKVVAYWPDLEKAEYGEVYYPAGAPASDAIVHRLPHPYNTEAEAKEAARAKYNEVNRDDKTLSLTTIGNPDITAEGKISVSKLRSDVNGNYIVKSATHNFSSGGYQTFIQAYVEP